jgi:hypothetical protein
MMSFLKNDLSGTGWAEELLLLVNSTFRNTIVFDVSGVTYSLANYPSFRVLFSVVINRKCIGLFSNQIF